MRGVGSILLMAASAVLAAVASVWMAFAAPVVRLAVWLGDKAKALNSFKDGGRP